MIKAESFGQGGEAEALVLAALLLAEKATSWGDPTWLTKVVLEDAFGSFGHVARLGPAGGRQSRRGTCAAAQGTL